MKTLRPYQQDCINTISKSMDEETNKVLISMATGLGKSLMAAQGTEQLGFNSTIWVTHRDELVSQSGLVFIADKFGEEKAKEIGKLGYSNFVKQGGTIDGFKMGLVKAEHFYPDGNVVMTSPQTLFRRVDKLSPDKYDCQIVDEAHWGLKLLERSVNHFQPRLRLGMTATPSAESASLFDKLIFEYDIKDGIRNGYLCQLNGIRIKTNLSLDKVHTVGGEFNQRELANEVNCYSRNKLVVNSYIKYAKGRQGIFFCVDIKHCLDLLELFIEAGINADVVSSDEEKTGDRKAKIKAFENKEIDVLINVEILTTGYNYPEVGVIGMVCPTKSRTKYFQCVGRGSRLKSDEFVALFGQNCCILDFVDNTSKHSLVNAWELDRGEHPNDRIFITDETREKLLSARIAKVDSLIDKDEFLNLLPLPHIKLKKNIKMDNSPISSAQILQLKNWGYDVENNHYTKEMVQEIYLSRPADQKIINLLKIKGYDTSNGVTIGQAQLILSQINKRR